MIFKDKIQDILTMFAGQVVYNPNRTTTPSNLNLRILNQAKDWLCMYKMWRDLMVEYTAPLDANRAIVLPDDCGVISYVYSDPAGISKPVWSYFNQDCDVSRRYTDFGTTYDDSTGVQVRKIQFPKTVMIPANPTIVYSKVLRDYTQADSDNGMISFFPLGVMLAIMKKLMQDYYGKLSQDDPNWINQRVVEELRMLEGYMYQPNTPMDLQVKDIYGNPVRISGNSYDGISQTTRQVSPFLPSTFFSGGVL